MRSTDEHTDLLRGVISQKLIRARLRNNRTQKDMAKDAGISLRQYQYFESGNCAPNIDTLCRIAGALHVHPSYVLPTKKELIVIYG